MLKFFKKITKSSLIFFPLLLLAPLYTVSAQGFTNPLGFGTLSGFLNAILEVVLVIAYPIVVVAIVYTGFLFVTAGGNEAKLTKAKQALVWTLIGAMIVLGAFILAQAVQGTVDEIKADAGSTKTLVINR